MKNIKEEYYVYVYIDPRNFEEFYFGKGKGKRKDAHLLDTSDSEKTKRINAIKKEGLLPIIKVIAKDLSEHDAFMIEKTLIWKLGKTLTNISPGHFADKFRPHNTIHLDLAYFDFKNGLYYVNVGENETRSWIDCKKYGFLAAGQDKKWSDPIRMLEGGDTVVAYLKLNQIGGGYVGIGKVRETAVKVDEFKYKGKAINAYDLNSPEIYRNCDNDKSEYLVKIDWIKAVDRKNGKWKKNENLFTTQQIRASLQGKDKTLKFIEDEFQIKFDEIMSSENTISEEVK